MECLTAQRFSLRSTNVDHVRSFCGKHFFPRRFLRPLGRCGDLAARFHVLRLGPLTVCDARYGADVTLGYDGPDGYQVGVPLAGHLTAHQGGRLLIGAGSRAVVARAVEDIVVDRWSADCRQLVVKIDQEFVENHLQSHLGATVRGPLRLAGVLDVGAGVGRSWAAMVRLLASEFAGPTGMVDQPLAAGRLIDLLTAGLLVAVEHPHRAVLARSEPAYRSPAVRRAVEAVQACPEHPFTAVELARVAGVSVRTLQAGFRRYLDCTPMAYVRDVRLARAHDDLRTADPALTTVAAVAYRWGFFHVGRFAAAYRARYHTAPSRTLRKG